MIGFIDKKQEKRDDRNGQLKYVYGVDNLALEKRCFDCKGSDFIRKIKRAKSIMIAHKHRKQKNVLNAYFMDYGRKKKSAQKMGSNQSILSDIRRREKIGVGERNGVNLLPPVHSSVQIHMNMRKKRDFDEGMGCDRVSQNFGVLSTRVRRQSSMNKGIERYKQIEINKSVQNVPRWQSHEKVGRNGRFVNKSGKVGMVKGQQYESGILDRMIGVVRKNSNHNRSLTEQRVEQNKGYKIERWSFAQDLYESYRK